MRAGVGAGEAVDGLGGAHAGDVVQGPVEGANRTESADDSCPRIERGRVCVVGSGGEREASKFKKGSWCIFFSFFP